MGLGIWREHEPEPPAGPARLAAILDDPRRRVVVFDLPADGAIGGCQVIGKCPVTGELRLFDVAGPLDTARIAERVAGALAIAAGSGLPPTPAGRLPCAA